jgi:hypothetical protein
VILSVTCAYANGAQTAKAIVSRICFIFLVLTEILSVCRGAKGQQ